MIVATWSDSVGGLQDAFHGQLKNAGIRLEHTDEDFSWSAKLDWQERVANEHKDETVVLADAWDVILNSPDQLSSLGSRGFFDHVTISGDSSCWPEAHLELRFERNGVWSYVCAGVIAGPGGKLAEIIERGRYLGLDVNVQNQTDQSFWAMAYLEIPGAMVIDYDTELVMSLSKTPPEAFDINESGRIYNTSNLVEPAFVHFNGNAKTYFVSIAHKILGGIS